MRLVGVEPSVNFAGEKAAVRFSPQKLDPEKLIGAVREAGYDAQVARGEKSATAQPSTAPRAAILFSPPRLPRLFLQRAALPDLKRADERAGFKAA